MKPYTRDINNDESLKKWCSDCEYKCLTYLHDPCHNCTDEFNGGVPKYYKEEKPSKIQTR